MTIEEFKNNRKLKILVITLSDRASRGEYKDLSGPEIENSVIRYLQDKNWNFNTNLILMPDNASLLEKELYKAKELKFDIIITTGGTGIGPRDFTPEVAKKVIEKEI